MKSTKAAPFQTASSGISLGRISLFYHFLHPDKVVSAVHFTDLCVDLRRSGWEVSAFAVNRDSADSTTQYPRRSVWKGIEFHRLWRPAWQQASSIGRFLNAVWVMLGWSFIAWRRRPTPDVVIIGTDPVLSVLLAAIWRRLHPEVKIVHWCFDLYPEAAFADGVVSPFSLVARLLRLLLRRSYACCDLVVDIGACMRKRLRSYDQWMQSVTLVPWALSEPAAPLSADIEERLSIFGHCELALMYSGSFGRAHSSEEMLELMRLMRSDSVHLALCVKGNRVDELKASLTDIDTNISFAAFAPHNRLNQRLGCANIQVITLREEWTGTVVPSKFFGALAAGRPVLFCGSRQCCVAQWIEQYGLGWVLSDGKEQRVAEQLRLVMADKSLLLAMNRRCHATYHEHFSRALMTEQWNRQLRMLVANQ